MRTRCQSLGLFSILIFSGLGTISCAGDAGTVEGGADPSVGATANALHSGCSAGTACQPTNPCEFGKVSCLRGRATCVATGNLPAGTACATGSVCDSGGSCVPTCHAGSACRPGNPCKFGVISCSTGVSDCVEAGNLPVGTACGTNSTCNSGGSCVSACHAGGACQPGNPCKFGVISCSTGVSVCVEAGNLPVGTACGTNSTCNSGGSCVSACHAGGACQPGNPCKFGAISCSTGVSVCVEAGNLPVGTACGTNMSCDGSGTCR